MNSFLTDGTIVLLIKRLTNKGLNSVKNGYTSSNRLTSFRIDECLTDRFNLVGLSRFVFPIIITFMVQCD